MTVTVRQLVIEAVIAVAFGLALGDLAARYLLPYLL